MARSYYGNSPENIRRAILNGSIKATDAKARFVGRDGYVAAGGRVERDLFGSDDDETWVDVDLIEDLAGQKLAAAADELVVSEGLAFATPVLGTSGPYHPEPQPHPYQSPVPPPTPGAEGTQTGQERVGE